MPDKQEKNNFEEWLKKAEEDEFAGNEILKDVLNVYYIETRYPGDYPDFTLKEAKEAKEAADKIKGFVFNKINKV